MCAGDGEFVVVVCVQVTVSLVIMSAYVEVVNELIRAVQSRRRHIKIVKLSVDVVASSLQSTLLTTLQATPSSINHVLFLLPW